MTGLFWYPDLCDNCGRRFDTYVCGPRMCTPCLVAAFDLDKIDEDDGRILVERKEHDEMSENNDKAVALNMQIGCALYAFERGEITLTELYTRVKDAHGDWNK